MEYKTSPAAIKSIEDRTVVGIAAVHGVVDSGFDRSHPGSFADIKINGRNRTKFLWQHNGNEPPIAKINYVREVPRNDLPQEILSLAPEATGGVEVSRTYLNSERANDVLDGLTQKTIDEMSYAYNVKSYSFTEEDGKPPVRELLRLEIFDFSDVNWGMNAFTLGSKVWSGDALTFVQHSEMVVNAVEEYAKRAKDRNEFRTKEGRVLSGAIRGRIEALVDNLKTVSGELAQLLKETEPKAEPDPAKARALFIQFQQTLAQLNGVQHAN